MGPSVQQLLIVLVIVVLLFGAKKIPELAKGIGKGIKSFKSEMQEDETAATKSDAEKIEKTQENSATTQNVEETKKA
ncbi:MAG TPA: twin-arginine translocase TatA/TatE family subunit [Sulfurospirillum sp. UBA11407]|nr:MAG TPA: twin-arginine translocase TatA/TatE family subunit [Sulfurospirillum sp. UBA11407]